MASSKTKYGVLLTVAVLLACSGGSEGGKPAADYWVVDRIEGGIAVLENAGTLRTAERPVGELPRNVKEGHVLRGGGEGGSPPRLDRGETAARAARLRERFERLK
jgi:hypothetical protein